MSRRKAFSLYDNTGYWVNLLAARMRDRFEQRIKPLGITPPHFGLMLVLHRGDARTPLQLARHVGHHAAAITRHLDRLEEKRLIARKSDPDDRRSVTLRLTPAGRAVIRRALPIAQRMQTQFDAALSPTERKRFNATLRLLINHTTDADR